MADDKEVTGGNGWDSNCSMEPKIEVEDSDNRLILFDGVCIGEGLRTYERRKRRKMSYSDDIITNGFNDKKKAADGNAFDQYVHRLSSNGPGECSLRKCRNIVLQPMHQSPNGHEGCIQNALVTYPESNCTPVNKESVDNVRRSDNQTYNFAQEPSHVLSSGLLKQSECSTSSELLGHSLSDILNSDEFSELRCLLLKSFGVVNVNRVVNVDSISLKLKNGDYETSPMQYFKDIQLVCTKLQQVGNKMVTLANSLSDKCRDHYEQFVRKPTAAEARGCQECGGKTDVKNCLVCDSCEDIYHLSCAKLVGTQIPPKSWYCTSCVLKEIGPPHDSCIVCEKLKSAALTPQVNGVPANDQSQDVPDGLDEHLKIVSTDESQSQDESQSSKICFICKSEVKGDDNFRICGHLLCAHKFYHYKCLTSKELRVYSIHWYCPSCLCRHCFQDKDDDQIVLCDGCDQAYHIYCASPPLDSIPVGNWFCERCDSELEKIGTMKRLYENMQKKVKIEEGSEKDEHEGLDMLVTAAKTLSHEHRGGCNLR